MQVGFQTSVPKKRSCHVKKMPRFCTSFFSYKTSENFSKFLKFSQYTPKGLHPVWPSCGKTGALQNGVKNPKIFLACGGLFPTHARGVALLLETFSLGRRLAQRGRTGRGEARERKKGSNGLWLPWGPQYFFKILKVVASPHLNNFKNA